MSKNKNESMFKELQGIIKEFESEYHCCLSTLNATDDMRQQIRDVSQLNEIIRAIDHMISHCQPLLYNIRGKYEDSSDLPF